MLEVEHDGVEADGNDGLGEAGMARRHPGGEDLLAILEAWAKGEAGHGEPWE
jgi:hypothetical protein